MVCQDGVGYVPQSSRDEHRVSLNFCENTWTIQEEYEDSFGPHSPPPSPVRSGFYAWSSLYEFEPT